MGCCLVALIASFAPRIALILVWIFTSQVKIAFHNVFIWPFLGLLFLPFTTMFYALAYQPGLGISGWGYVFVVIGFFLDLSSYGSGGYSRHK